MTAAMLAVPALPAHAGTDGITTPVPAPSGRPRTSFSFRPWVSGDGRYVAFDSDSATLVPGDTNGGRDVFVFDRATGVTTRITYGHNGEEADGQSQRPTLSGDGRFVAFWSDATNLVEHDDNGLGDSFVHDRLDGTTVRVSVDSSGSEANGESLRPVISADGQVVAFESSARDLLPGDILGRPADSNQARDIFVRDLAAGTTTRVSVGSDGAQGAADSVRPSISADGRYVAFHSAARLAPADRNAARDVYVHDRSTGETTLVSEGAVTTERAFGSFSPSISADGRYIAFWSNATGLVPDDDNGASDIFVRDMQTGRIEKVSQSDGGEAGDDDSSDPSISPDGRYVAFWSLAANLVPGDDNGFRDVFLADRQESLVTRASVASDGSESDADCYSPNINGGGRLVVFDSQATTLVAGDSNKGSDIFIHTR